ncbi:beta-galactosidase [Parabacteroides sp. AM58-2XD]|uniref:glycoside hydrolase family 2 protein n=2 Tax=Parabacteroides TaxID=375288 RepID=UPI000FE1EC75|nr:MULTISPECIES: glycoside hydrolase family 2 TIM barrel-domain containing protein [Parabacteroides]MCM0719924.1 beta-galactosidase [Parabacteroides sp. W1-Q-101]RGY94503.1 beta-galactosidase [Parabacteroides sp. AM58-2XD]GKG74004.1 beta-galactosidase [Parabacteroides goldsteinii]GKG82589.1 beta-galactosidase [Parabacteroides goldsteinii]
MNKRVLSLTLLLACLGLMTMQAEGRKVESFNSGWSFKKAPAEKELAINAPKWDKGWSEVEIPHTWNAKDMQVQANSFYEGAAYYKKQYFFPAELKDKRVFLRFEGVGSCAEVFVNGMLATSHKGGYSAFACEISPLLKAGEENEIIVKADNKSRPDVIPVNHNLFGVYGGIYRPVWLVVTEPYNISVTDCASPGVYITQKNVSKKQADVKVKVKLDNGTLQPAPVTLQNTIYDQEGKQVATHSQSFELSAQGEQAYESSFTIKKPTLWQGRENPYLYKVVSRLIKDGQVIDEMVQPLGLRKYEIVAGKGFYLNGEKYPMYGVTRHQDWWGLGSALKNENHDFDLATIMDVGATTVRFAHYQQSDYLYSRCDSLGLIIWAEIPFVNRVTGQEAENCRNQLREMIRQSFNHPSIYVWGLHNEVYQPHQYTKELTQSLHDLAKTEDPDRYTVSVNGYGHMEHPVNLVADIQGMNRYFGWYEKKIQDIKPWVENLEKEYPHQKLMLTEYGADANLNHQTEYLGDALNWTKEFYPETFATKTHEYQWSVIAAHPYIIASYLWNTFDFCAPMWVRGGVPARNMKGLVTFDRKIKKDSYFWYKANWSKEPVLYLTQRRNWDREKKETSVTVYSNIGTPKVYLNGKELTGIREGYTPVHYIIDNITLDMGKNIVKTVVVKNGKTYEDEIEWVYNGEKKRDSDQSVNKEEHAGF